MDTAICDPKIVSNGEAGRQNSLEICHGIAIMMSSFLAPAGENFNPPLNHFSPFLLLIKTAGIFLHASKP
jgi:hypothetical protein